LDRDNRSIGIRRKWRLLRRRYRRDTRRAGRRGRHKQRAAQAIMDHWWQRVDAVERQGRWSARDADAAWFRWPTRRERLHRRTRLYLPGWLRERGRCCYWLAWCKVRPQ